MPKNYAEYFLAANSSVGFFSLFDELSDYTEGWHNYIIKGGPGTGKSGLMKKAVSAALKKGYKVEKILCSSDPDSLDGVIIPEIKLSFADGTAPHIIDPKYPGCVDEIIYLGQFWDSKKLNNQYKRISTLTDCNKALHSHSAKYVTASTMAMKDNERIIKSAFNSEKAFNYATRFITRNCKCSNCKGNEKRRFINGITPQGYISLYSTVSSVCERIYSVSDEFWYASASFMNILKRTAISNGIDVISCLNPFDPEGYPLHVILPEEKIGFFTNNKKQNFKDISDKNIYSKRFLDNDIIYAHKQRMEFNLKTAYSLLDESVKILKKAKTVHDDLESCYINSMNFNLMNEYSEKLLSEII